MDVSGRGDSALPLSGVNVAEIGSRVAAGACGGLLAQLGATVVMVEPEAAEGGKWSHRAVMSAGKLSFTPDPGDDVALGRLLKAADVVVLSSDIDGEQAGFPAAAEDGHVVCDITAYGRCTRAGMPAHSDAFVQARAGIIDTTGPRGAAPAVIGGPILEMATAPFAAAAILVALRVRRTMGSGQLIDMALYDVAVNTLINFLPLHFSGMEPTRSGNRHPLYAPWGAYPTADGWVQVCTVTDDQWRRLSGLIGYHGGPDDPLATPGGRVQNFAMADALVSEWTATQTSADCIAVLTNCSIACGPVLKIEDLPQEPNIIHRKAIVALDDPVTGNPVVVPGALLQGPDALCRAPSSIPRPGEHTGVLDEVLAQRPVRQGSPPAKSPGAAPLTGVRVLEIGQYTTAPLAARHLGSLGADVIKIESPSGDAIRNSPPLRGGDSYIFVLSNSDKRSVELDLRSSDGMERLRQLIGDADVLVENLKPGSLGKLGFTWPAMRDINPRLIYCAVNGFGSNSIYAGRPALDTVLQAMAGIMDLTHCDGVPTKTGISSADMLGGEFALVAILAALEEREASGRGRFIDIAMHDCAAWATQTAWNGGRDLSDEASLVACCDGYVAVSAAGMKAAQALRAIFGAERLPTRAEAATLLAAPGRIVEPVRIVPEVLIDSMTRDRGLLVTGHTRSGAPWTLLGSPLRLTATPPVIARAIGVLGEANGELFGLGKDRLAKAEADR